jgi:hypothetical protein
MATLGLKDFPFPSNLR